MLQLAQYNSTTRVQLAVEKMLYYKFYGEKYYTSNHSGFVSSQNKIDLIKDVIQ